MIVLFEGSFKHYAGVESLSHRKLCIVKYERTAGGAEQVVVEDLGHSRDAAPRPEHLSYVYSLAEAYSRRIELSDRSYALIVNGASGFDLGFSLYLLNRIYNEVESPSVALMVEVPGLDSSASARARFYSWLKAMFLHDVLINVGGSMKYTFVDPDQPPQLFGYLTRILLSERLSSLKSLLHIKLKRFVFPLAELHALSSSLALLGRVKRAEESYRRVLLLMNKTLDSAPTELWSTARGSVDAIRGSIYIYKKLVSQRKALAESVSSAASRIARGCKYSTSIVDLAKLLSDALSGRSIKELYDEVLSAEVLRERISSPRDSLVDVYSLGSVDACEFKRFAAASSDLAAKLPSEVELVLIDGAYGELSVLDACEVPVNSDCKLGTNYLPRELVEAYSNVYGLQIEQLYPRKLVFGERAVEPASLHEISLVNYSGYLEAVRRKCKFIGLKLIRDVAGESE